MPNARNVKQIISDSRKRKYPLPITDIKKATPPTPSTIPINKIKKVTLDDFYKKATTSKKAKNKR